METNNKEQMWALLGHLGAFLAFLLPFSNFVFLIIILLNVRDRSQFISTNIKEAINFQLTCLFVGVICWFLSFIFIGVYVAAIWFTYAFIEIIMASVKSCQGKVFNYTFSFRFIK